MESCISLQVAVCNVKDPIEEHVQEIRQVVQYKADLNPDKVNIVDRHRKCL